MWEEARGQSRRSWKEDEDLLPSPPLLPSYPPDLDTAIFPSLSPLLACAA